MSAAQRKLEPQLRLPLPNALNQVIADQRPHDGDNLSLWLDKLVRVDAAHNWELRAEVRVAELERLFCPQDLGAPRPWRCPAAAAALERLEAACESVYGPVGYRALTVEVQGRLVIDYGRASTHEASLSLHPVFGCPRIPGSAIKGLLRAWLGDMQRSNPLALLKLLGDPNPTHDEGDSAVRSRASYIVNQILGAPDAEVDGIGLKSQRGRLVVHDALPESGIFQLAVDVLTPHMGDYYLGDEPPADWLSPVPFTFLSVVKTRFRIHIGWQSERGGYWRGIAPSAQDGVRLDNIAAALGEALEIEGIGAKRAAGYGRLMQVR